MVCFYASLLPSLLAIYVTLRCCSDGVALISWRMFVYSYCNSHIHNHLINVGVWYERISSVISGRALRTPHGCVNVGARVVHGASKARSANAFDDDDDCSVIQCLSLFQAIAWLGRTLVLSLVSNECDNPQKHLHKYSFGSLLAEMNSLNSSHYYFLCVKITPIIANAPPAKNHAVGIVPNTRMVSNVAPMGCKLLNTATRLASILPSA